MEPSKVGPNTSIRSTQSMATSETLNSFPSSTPSFPTNRRPHTMNILPILLSFQTHITLGILSMQIHFILFVSGWLMLQTSCCHQRHENLYESSNKTSLCVTDSFSCQAGSCDKQVAVIKDMKSYMIPATKLFCVSQ